MPFTKKAVITVHAQLTEEACDKAAALATASTKVGSTAALAVLRVVQAQAGASTTAKMTHLATELISKRLDILTNAIENATSRVVGLEAMVTTMAQYAERTGDFADTRAREIANLVKDTVTGPDADATVAALLTAEINITCAVTNVVSAHVSIAKYSKEPIQTIKELALTIMHVASEAARGVADAVAITDDTPPPPYTGCA